VLKLLIKN